MKIIGMSLYGHHSSVALIDTNRPIENSSIFLKERFTRIKADSGIHTETLKKISKRSAPSSMQIAESSYFARPSRNEDILLKRLPYGEKLKRLKLERFSSHLNPKIRFYPHHYCHARAAMATSPFKKALILVMDGAGSSRDSFDPGHPELSPELSNAPVVPRSLRKRTMETCTAYLQDGNRLTCIYKEWTLLKRHSPLRGMCYFVMDSLGYFYENSALYIFNSYREAGKVMGLAPFGRAKFIRNRAKYFQKLDWARSFRSKGKSSWERSPNLKRYRDIAASVQLTFEHESQRLVRELRRRFPGYRNLVFTGGCALNCINNDAILNSGLFDSVYIPPFPSDECIGFGAAHALANDLDPRKKFRPIPWSNQTASLGDPESVPSSKEIRRAFAGFKVRAFDREELLMNEVADELARGGTVGWFRGRSEVGPRALGNRSILAHPGWPGMKEQLNSRVKFREGFRPFGVSCTLDQASVYFDFPRLAESPFMSFAPRVRRRYRDQLSEVTHVDRTSRIQTVRKSQNPALFSLLKLFGRQSGVECLLNTSLNVMGEPLAETVEDAARLFRTAPLTAMVVEGWLVTKMGKS